LDNTRGSRKLTSHSWPRFLTVVPTPLSPAVGRMPRYLRIGCIFILLRSVHVRFIVLMYVELLVAVWCMGQKRWTCGVACSETVRSVSSGRIGLLFILTDRPTGHKVGFIKGRFQQSRPPSVARVMSVVIFLLSNQRDALIPQIYFSNGTLHVSDSFSVLRQES